MSESPFRIHALPADVARMVAEQVAQANQERDAAQADLARLLDGIRSAAKKLADDAAWAEAYSSEIAGAMRETVEALAALCI